MGFSMNFNKEQLSGSKPPLPDGWYTLQLKGFAPKLAGANKDSVSLNPEIVTIGNPNPDLNDRRVFENLNSKAGWIIQDFVHACGLQMEEVQDGNQGTEAASYTLPGVFDGSDKFPEDPAQWKYLGPLTNKTFEAEIFTSEYNGKKSNKIRQYKCAVPGCTQKHSTNLS